MQTGLGGLLGIFTFFVPRLVYDVIGQDNLLSPQYEARVLILLEAYIDRDPHFVYIWMVNTAQIS